MNTLIQSDAVAALGTLTEFIEENGEVQTTVWDPPYNIGFNYDNPNFGDSWSEDEYYNWLADIAYRIWERTAEGGSFFFIHYAEQSAKFLNKIQSMFEGRVWPLHQWLTWVYPSNFGHSKRRFTTASRAVLWFSKGEPFFDPQGVTQPYKNPNDKRIKALIESGRTGTTHYDWLPVNLVKNVSSEKRYVNQIPEALLEILILNTTRPDDLVLDPTCGSGSTLRVASKYGRRGWGADISPVAAECWDDLKEVE